MCWWDAVSRHVGSLWLGMAGCRFNFGTNRMCSKAMLGKISSLQRSRELKGSSAKAQSEEGENSGEGVLLRIKACRARREWSHRTALDHTYNPPPVGQSLLTEGPYAAVKICSLTCPCTVGGKQESDLKPGLAATLRETFFSFGVALWVPYFAPGDH